MHEYISDAKEKRKQRLNNNMKRKKHQRIEFDLNGCWPLFTVFYYSLLYNTLLLANNNFLLSNIIILYSVFCVVLLHNDNTTYSIHFGMVNYKLISLFESPSLSIYYIVAVAVVTNRGKKIKCAC